MNDDQLKESSLFDKNEGETSADARFVVGRGERLRSTRQEALEQVHNLPEGDSKNLRRVMGRLKVRPSARQNIGSASPVSVEPLTVEDAEKTILSVFNEPKSTDALFLEDEVSEVKSYRERPREVFDDLGDAEEDITHTRVQAKKLKSSKKKKKKRDPDFDELDGLEESSVPTLASNSEVISSQAPSEHSDVSSGPFESVASIDILEKVATIRCTVCDEKNLEAATYCSRCGSLLKFGARQGFGRADVSLEPTAMSWTPNQELNAYLIAINDDGTEGKRIAVEFMETILGRETDSPFPTDSFLSPKHAKLIVKSGKLYIQDLNSLNGTFVKLRQEKVIQSGDTFLMGRQVLSFEEVPVNPSIKLRAPDGTRKMGSPATDSSYRLLQIGIGGVLQNVYCLPKAGAQLGRERGDIIFPHDKFMSSRHAQIYRRNDGEFVLADLNSSNGTWIKIWELTPLETQDYIFMGQQLFRVLIDQ